MERSRQTNLQSALLCIPAHERRYVDRRPRHVEVLGKDGLVADAPEGGKQRFQLALAPAVALSSGEGDIEVRVLACVQAEVEAGEDPKPADPLASREQIGQKQRAARRKDERAVQENRVHPQTGLNLYARDPRLACPVPVFQCSFQVALHEVDSGQEIGGIRIARVELHGAPQPPDGFRITLLLEDNAT